MGNYVGETYYRRLVVFYIPLFLFVFVMIFPFIWMFITSIKPNPELYNPRVSPFMSSKTQHWNTGKPCLVARFFVDWAINTLWVAIASTLAFALCRCAGRLRTVTLDLSRLDNLRDRHLHHLPCPTHFVVHTANRRGFLVRNSGHILVADLHLSDLPGAVLYLAFDGLLPNDTEGT